MNETTGQVFDAGDQTVASGSLYGAKVEVRPIPDSGGGPADRTNRIRFALFDSHGNESMVRVRLDQIPDPVPDPSCPSL